MTTQKFKYLENKMFRIRRQLGQVKEKIELGTTKIRQFKTKSGKYGD